MLHEKEIMPLIWNKKSQQQLRAVCERKDIHQIKELWGTPRISYFPLRETSR